MAEQKRLILLSVFYVKFLTGTELVPEWMKERGHRSRAAGEETVLMSAIKGNTRHNHLTSVIYCNHQRLLLAPRLGINPRNAH